MFVGFTYTNTERFPLLRFRFRPQPPHSINVRDMII